MKSTTSIKINEACLQMPELCLMVSWVFFSRCFGFFCSFGTFKKALLLLCFTSKVVWISLILISLMFHPQQTFSSLLVQKQAEHVCPVIMLISYNPIIKRVNKYWIYRIAPIYQLRWVILNLDTQKDSLRSICSSNEQHASSMPLHRRESHYVLPQTFNC